MSDADPQPPLSGLRALAHPLRLRLLSLLTGAPMSSAETARELGESQANISYHIRQLHAVGLLDLVEEISVRGGRAKRYRHLPESGERLPKGSGADHRAVASVLAEELVRRSRERLPGAAGDFTDAELTLTPETWRRVKEMAAELGQIMHEEALPPGTEGAVRVSATVMLFPMVVRGVSASVTGSSDAPGPDVDSWVTGSSDDLGPDADPWSAGSSDDLGPDADPLPGSAHRHASTPEPPAGTGGAAEGTR
ncbi:helix-turn-helix domain-containing protein [Streptomyces sp. NPDC057638]|uniref:helix-turn-helix domain-containing protein n=1 Tax=Streptomyces sp. NPDC057638 TaxID=3346190 RepID=UPI00369D95C3